MPTTNHPGALPPAPGIVPAAACAAAGTALAALVVLARGWGAWLPPALVLAAIAPYLAYTDWTRRRLPNRVLAPAYAAATATLIAAAAVEGPASALIRAGITSLIALTAFTAVAVATSGIAGGDVKLIGLIALCLSPDGWTAPVLAILSAFALATVAIAAHALAARLRHHPRPTTIPLGPYLAAAALIVMTWPEPR